MGKTGIFIPMTNPSHPGPYLRMLRKTAGLSVEAVAASVGTSVEYLTQTEAAQTAMPLPSFTARVSHAVALGLKAAA